MAANLVATNFKPIGKSTLVGSFDLEIVSWTLCFKGMLWHRREGREWINFPAKEWTDRDGKKAFVNIVEFSDKAMRDRFQAAALAAVHLIAAGP